MKICPSCQEKFQDDAVICGHCGARLLLDTSSTFADPKQQLIGRVIAANYKVEKLLGKGGMGAVFQARQLSLDREVAVKVLLAPLAMDEVVLERFQREARSASNVGHPGIVQVIDMGYLKEGPPFMVMELLEGEDLRYRLRREGALKVEQLIPVMLQVCDALQAAHDKGVIHRDLKPDNIFLVYRKGKVPIVKILDFGLSKIRSGGKKLTQTGTLVGTPNYMAPEQIAGEKEVDHRADIYAMGVIFYEGLTGKMAYDGPSVQSIFYKIMSSDPVPPRSIRPDIPESLEALVMKAMARDPDQRFKTVSEMAEELARVGSDVGLTRSQMSVVPTVESQAGEAAPSLPAAPAPSPPQVFPVTPPGGAQYYTPPQQAAPSPAYGSPSMPSPIGIPTPAATAAPPKKSKGAGIGLIIGILAIGFLLVVAIIAAFFFYSIFLRQVEEPPPVEIETIEGDEEFMNEGEEILDEDEELIEEDEDDEGIKVY